MTVVDGDYIEFSDEVTPVGIIVPDEEAVEFMEDFKLIPGPQGLTGPQGIQGTPGVGSVNVPTVLTNLVTNPSGETGTTGWLVTNATFAQSAVQALFGANSILATITSTSGGIYHNVAGLVVGKTYTASAYIYVPSGVANPGWRIRVGGAVNQNGSVSVMSGAWVRIVHTFIATATSLPIYAAFVSSGGTANTSQAYVDGFMVTEGVVAPDYFDGTMAGCYWSGTAHASTSIKGLRTETDALDVWDMPELSRNLVRNPTVVASGSPWITVTGPAGTMGSVDQPLVNISPTSYKVVSDATATIQVGLGITNAEGIPAAATKTYAFSVYVFTSVARQVHARIRWNDSAGNSISIADGTVVSTTAGVWTRISVIATAPSGTVAMSFRAVFLNTALNDNLYTTGAMVTETIRVLEYFDGSKSGSRWLGTPHASESIKLIHSASDFNLLTWLDAGLAQGVGSPEGVLTAPIGARYVDTAGTAGAVEWLKMSGTGNTGWRVSEGDTGLRAVVSHQADGTVNVGAYGADWGPHTNGGGIWVQRRNDTVHVHIEQVKLLVNSSANPMYTLPVGFRPWRPQRVLIDGWPSGAGPAKFFGMGLNSNGSIARGSNTSVLANDVILTMEFVYLTREAWPASLPGVAA